MATETDTGTEPRGEGRQRNGTAKREQARPHEEEHAVAPIDPGAAIEMAAAFARENPHAAIAGAAVVGFLLGGGLTPKLLGAVGMIAARRYLKQGIQEAMEA